MRAGWICLLVGALLMGCAVFPPAGPAAATEPFEEVLAPTITFVPSATPSQPAAITETPPPAVQCAWSWAEQALPEVSASLAREFQEAGMEDVEAGAYAFGENCLTGLGDTPPRFVAMQTDFRLVIPVEKLTDKQALGGWIERVMPVIEDIPAEHLPGPKLGQVSIRFTSLDSEVNLQFSRERAKSLMADGNTGSVLYDALHLP